MCFAKWFGVGKRNKMDIFGRQDLCFMHVQSQDIAFFVGIDVFWSIPIIGRMAGSVSPTSENIHFSTKGWPETCCTSHMVFCIPTGKIEGYLLMKSFPHLWDETVSKCLIFFGGRGSKIRLSIIPNPPPKHKLTSTFNFRTSTVYICTNRPLEHFLFVVNPNESWV